MQHISTQLPNLISNRGGRISSAELRHSIQMSEDFAGLETDTNRYDLLLLVKRTGKSAGFSSKMIMLLDYYMAFTRDIDWEEGSRPIVYQSLSKTALDLGVSERQIQHLEQALFEAQALTWKDSGNHRRFGQRCPDTGRILYAFGVDLTPLAYLKAELQAKLHEKQLYDRAWLETKRQISFYRRQICAVLAEGEGADVAQPWVIQAAARYEELSVPIRTYMKVEMLRDLLARHKALHAEILAQVKEESAAIEQVKTDKDSPRDERNFVHYNSSNQEPSDKSDTSRPQANCFQESVVEPPKHSAKSEPSQKPEEGREEKPVQSGTGLRHITLKQALNAASERFRAHIPLHPRAMNWHDLVEAAYRLRPELHISQKSWGEACITIGREGTAICLLLTDQAMQREGDPVRNPGAYFRAMINRARAGELHLHNSVFGILKRGEEGPVDH